MGGGRLWRPVVDKKAGLKLNEIRKLEVLYSLMEDPGASGCLSLVGVPEVSP